ncbi:hypothetical protein FOA43_001565 [Brettanomyces nanus]|uniref:Plasma membrane fusion protein PRM1 n=1 Tax=Eeniella nana TaxID=13502 RepID=A0A875RNW7_EENNA|nr:uncharacterized protein FOA43_001565 [Brettanomyces nanus]QPG74240.1 hypothetical protein FOA43_001565 [Brettanomyces nanus]
MIIFAINLTIGIYVCLLTSAIDISADVALNATESVIKVANDTIISLADDLEDGLSEISTISNKIISAVDDTVSTVEDIFGSDDNGNDKKLQHRIGKGKINETANSKEFKSGDLYVPDTKTVTFCRSSNEIEEFYDEAGKIIYRISMILVAVLILAMIAMMIYESWCEYRNWSRIKHAAGDLQNLGPESSENIQRNIEVLDSFQNRSANMVSSILGRLASLNNPIAQNRLRWMVNYGLSPYALPVLLLGLVGLISFGFQSAILHSLSTVDTKNVEEFIQSASNKVSQDINGSVEDWCSHTNKYILAYQDDLNDNMLGWVRSTTESVNDTVNEFTEEMNERLKDIFGDTPLYQPIQSVVGCVLTTRLMQITKAMEWVHEKADVSLPKINSTEFLDQAFRGDDVQNSSKVMDQLKSVKNDMKSMIKSIVKGYRKTLLIELYISLGLVGLWICIMVLGGVILVAREHTIKKSTQETGMFAPVTRIPSFVTQSGEIIDSFGTNQSIKGFQEKTLPKQEAEKEYFSDKGVINKALSKLLRRLNGNSADSIPDVHRPNIHATDSTLSGSFTDFTDSFTDPGMSTAYKWKL